jgi:hypothetical protein
VKPWGIRSAEGREGSAGERGAGGNGEWKGVGLEGRGSGGGARGRQGGKTERAVRACVRKKIWSLMGGSRL